MTAAPSPLHCAAGAASSQRTAPAPAAATSRDRAGRSLTPSFEAHAAWAYAARMTGQFQLTDDQLAIQDMARKFTADRITPFAAQWDEDHHFPRDVVQGAG